MTCLWSVDGQSDPPQEHYLNTQNPLCPHVTFSDRETERKAVLCDYVKLNADICLHHRHCPHILKGRGV